MSIIKCKMCGGDLSLTEGSTVAECEYCGTVQTVPVADNEKKLTLFTRANRLRCGCEFDKAAGVYESIVAEFPEEAEAYWGLVLCKYGIEYVDDPATGKKIPTCHRSSFDSVTDDNNYDMTLEYADVVARRVYREEAKTIEQIRKGIIEVSSKEDPYDIFICYKETEIGSSDRTLDSVLAQDVYDALTEKGYRVFFSRITLEDKLGVEYEPYIFAALNSAKIMLAFGTDYEHYNAVWVKNEWSRYLKLMAEDRSKHLIPCYKDIDIEDMPKEFRKLQAQDLGKVGAMQDLLRGIEKILPRQIKNTIVIKQEIIEHHESHSLAVGPNIAALVKLGQTALEDRLWTKANGYFEDALRIDAECALAYLGYAMVENRCHDSDAFANLYIVSATLNSNKNVQRAKKYADEELLAWFALLDKKKEQAEREKQRQETEKTEAKLRQIEEEKQRRVANIPFYSRKREEIAKAQKLICCSGGIAFGLKTDGTVVEMGDRSASWSNVDDWTDITAIAAGGWHVVGLRSNGTVVAKGKNSDTYDEGQFDVTEWSEVIEIAAGCANTVGLKKDGSVVAVGRVRIDPQYADNWSNVVAICSAEEDGIAGLKKDGTVIVTDSDGTVGEMELDVLSWSGITTVVSGDTHTVGLKKDGTVLAAGYNDDGQCDVSEWDNIVAVAAGWAHTVGLKNDGTVIATGNNNYGQCNVGEWCDIVAVYAASDLTVGLKFDGTVVAVGKNENGECNVSHWSDIIAVYIVGWFCVGLRKDGTVMITCDPSDKDFICRKPWKLFNNYETLDEERELARLKRIAELKEERDSLRTELSNLKGLFTGKRRKEVEMRLAQIENILKGLN